MVGVPRGVLALLIGALIVLVAAVAFLVGQRTQTARLVIAPQPGAAQPDAAPSPTAEARVTEAPALPPSVAAPPTEPSLSGVPAPAAAPTAPTVVIPYGGAAPALALRGEVARYFQDMDGIASAAKTWSDPQAFAMGILKQAAEGDARGVDDLLAAQRGVRARMQQVAVPEPCREHHRASLAVMDEALSLLGSMRAGLMSQDVGALTNAATAGHALEAKVRATDAQAEAIKKQFGLVP